MIRSGLKLFAKGDRVPVRAPGTTRDRTSRSPFPTVGLHFAGRIPRSINPGVGFVCSFRDFLLPVPSGSADPMHLLIVCRGCNFGNSSLSSSHLSCPPSTPCTDQVGPWSPWEGGPFAGSVLSVAQVRGPDPTSRTHDRFPSPHFALPFRQAILPLA